MLLWFAAPLMPDNERYIVISGRGRASGGAQFNAVADQLVVLRDHGVIKEFGATSDNGGFWVTFPKPTVPYVAHIATFAEEARITAPNTSK